MLCTVQCRPASACARKSPPRGCTLQKQDKTRQDAVSKQATHTPKRCSNKEKLLKQALLAATHSLILTMNKAAFQLAMPSLLPKEEKVMTCSTLWGPALPFTTPPPLPPTHPHTCTLYTGSSPVGSRPSHFKPIHQPW